MILLFFKRMLRLITAEEYEHQVVLRKLHKNTSVEEHKSIVVRIRFDSTFKMIEDLGHRAELLLSTKNLNAKPENQRFEII